MAAPLSLIAMTPFLSLLIPLTLSGGSLPHEAPPIAHTTATDSVRVDADDPAIWVHPTDPKLSLILGTDKAEKDGAIYVFDLNGKIVQRVGGLAGPNNVDVELGVSPSGTMDIAVVTERKANRLRIFSIDRQTRKLTDISGSTAVFAGESGEHAEPMGIGVYKKSKDEVYAITSPKSGPKQGYMAQYRIVFSEKAADLRFVRRFGDCSGEEIEALVVDDELGFVYGADETAGIHKNDADPKRSGGDRDLSFFGRSGYQGDREGLAIWRGSNGTGYLVSTDQRPANSVFFVYDRVTNDLLGSFSGAADSTDGVEVCSAALGPDFPQGLFVAMNSDDRNFLLYDWRRAAKAALPADASKR